MKPKKSLVEKYPASAPCSCAVCVSYCRRPGWWTVEGAEAALQAGYGNRMMLEMGAGNAFAVLSPAFRGNEAAFAAKAFSNQGCTFLKNDRCELYGTGHQPLECRFCHHDRPGQGTRCHNDIEKQWNSAAGRALVVQWSNSSGFWREQAGGTGAPALSDGGQLPDD